MNYLTIAVLITIILLSYRVKGNVFNPATVFSTIWLAETISTSLGLYGMEKVSNEAYAMVLLGNVCFFIGCLPTKKGKVLIRAKTGVREDEINKTIFTAAVAVSLASLMVVMASVLSFMRRGYTYTNIRNMFFGYATKEQIVNNGLFMVFFSWVVVGLLYAIVPVSLVWLFEKKKGTKRFLPLLGLFAVVLYALATGGRNMFLVIGAEIVVIILYFKLHIPPKVKRIIALIGLIGVALMVYLTVQRRDNSVKINSVYAYTAITIPLLDHWTEYVSKNGLFTWGLSSIYGIIALVQWGAHVFDIELPIYTFVNEIINIPQNQWVIIFHKPSQQYNAFVSIFFTFYTDFGWIGIAVLSFLFGFAVNRVYIDMMRTKSKKYLAIYLFMIQMLILSFMRFGLSNPAYIVTLLALPFFFGKNKFIRI